MNRVTLCGNISTDIELKYTPSQVAVAKFSIACNRGKDKDGNDKGADFIPCEVWGKQAETIEKYFSKGKKILIEGRIQIDNYEKDGQRRSFTKVVIERFEFVEKSTDGVAKYVQEAIPQGFASIEEDIPF